MNQGFKKFILLLGICLSCQGVEYLYAFEGEHETVEPTTKPDTTETAEARQERAMERLRQHVAKYNAKISPESSLAGSPKESVPTTYKKTDGTYDVTAIEKNTKTELAEREKVLNDARQKALKAEQARISVREAAYASGDYSGYSESDGASKGAQQVLEAAEKTASPLEKATPEELKEMISSWTPAKLVQELDILSESKGFRKTKEFQDVLDKIIADVSAEQAKEILDWHTAKNFWISRLSDEQIQKLTEKVFDGFEKITDVTLITNLVKTKDFNFITITKDQVQKVNPETLKEVLKTINNSQRKELFDKIYNKVNSDQADAIFKVIEEKNWNIDYKIKAIIASKLSESYIKGMTSDQIAKMFNDNSYMLLSDQQVKFISPAILVEAFTKINKAIVTIIHILPKMSDEQVQAIINEGNEFRINKIDRILLQDKVQKIWKLQTPENLVKSLNTIDFRMSGLFTLSWYVDLMLPDLTQEQALAIFEDKTLSAKLSEQQLEIIFDKSITKETALQELTPRQVVYLFKFEKQKEDQMLYFVKLFTPEQADAVLKAINDKFLTLTLNSLDNQKLMEALEAKANSAVAAQK